MTDSLVEALPPGDRVAPSSARPLAAILPRGEALRNFVYSGALSLIQARTGVLVLSVSPQPDILNSLAQSYSEVRVLEPAPEHRLTRTLRELLDMAHGRVLWSEAAKERWRIRDYEADTASKKVKRLGKKMLCLPFASQPGVKLLSNAERWSSRVLQTSDQYVRMFRERTPSLVFNASHIHSSIAVQPVQAAQWLGIPTATFLFSWDNLTSQGRMMPLYDHYLVWNEAIAADLLRIYPSIRRDQVHVVGTPQFDFHFRPAYHWSREKFCARIGADSGRPVVLYSTGMANHMPGEHVLVERIADILGRLPERPQLLVRVYPKDLTGRFDELKNRRKDILFPRIPWEPAWLTPLPEDLPLLTNTLRHCAFGINVASTISLELCMFDKPVINIAYDPPGVEMGPVSFARYYEFDHYAPVVRSGAVSLARSEDELRRLSVEAFVNPGKASPARKAFLHSMFGDTLDGCCAKRIADTLVALARPS